MARLVFGMMQSLDGYVADASGGLQLPPPGERLSRYFNDYVRKLLRITRLDKLFGVPDESPRDEP